MLISMEKGPQFDWHRSTRAVAPAGLTRAGSPVGLNKSALSRRAPGRDPQWVTQADRAQT